MSKIATWQDIRDKGFLFIITNKNMNQCPTKSSIESEIRAVNITGSYSSNQLVQLDDVNEETYNYTIQLNARVNKVSGPSDYSKYRGASWRITSLPSGCTADAMSGTLTNGEWFENKDGFYMTGMTIIHKTTTSLGVLRVTISSQSYSVSLPIQSTTVYAILS